MFVIHRLRAMSAALALSAVAAAPFAASAGAVPDGPLRSSASWVSDSATRDATGGRPAVAAPPTWPTHPQALTAPAESVPADEDGPSWTAAVVLGGVLLFAAAALGALAGRATAGSRRARAEWPALTCHATSAAVVAARWVGTPAALRVSVRQPSAAGACASPPTGRKVEWRGRVLRPRAT
jgi:hypothetical protein